MIDGTAAIRSTSVTSGRLSERGAYSLMNSAAPKPTGTATASANSPTRIVPHSSEAMPNVSGLGQPLALGEEAASPGCCRAGQAPMSRKTPISPMTTSVGDARRARAAATKTAVLDGGRPGRSRLGAAVRATVGPRRRERLGQRRRCSSEPAVDVVGGAAVAAGARRSSSVSPCSTMWPGCVLGRQEERAAVGDPLGLLHVVGDDDDGDLVGDRPDGLLDPTGRGGVEGRAGLVHEQHVGAYGERAGDAEPLLLAAGERRAGRVEPVLDLLPEAGAAQALLDQVVGVAAAPAPCGR